MWLSLCVRLGFTTQQAEITVSALVKITDANMDIVYKDMVTKMQQVSWGTVANFKSEAGMLFVIHIFGWYSIEKHMVLFF